MRFCILLIFISFFSACITKEPKNDIMHSNNAYPLPDWVKNGTIYEVNIRQYTPEGTLNAFANHLPRLQEMGVKILWLMPIYPLSEKKRKGTLGSYYACSDFRDVNPLFGTKEDFKNLLQKTHELGMKLILDMVPNHTGWDHHWIYEHPEWYTQNDQGEIIAPLDPWSGEPTGWTDVADLNYNNADMRRALIADYKYWVEEMGINGFRMDMAHHVPIDFWRQLRDTLAPLEKELFMLAEADDPAHLNEGLFHANYAWAHHHLMNDVARGHKKGKEIVDWLINDRDLVKNGFHMYFISNHDENSWSKSEYERMGEAVKAMAVMTFTLDGIPLIYSGMEEPLKRSLEFFEKDNVGFGKYEFSNFYQTLIQLRSTNKALLSGTPENIAYFGADGVELMLYLRRYAGDEVLVIINPTSFEQEAGLASDFKGFTDVFTGQSVDLSPGDTLKLAPWEFIVAEKN